jgi:hypothetical protein
MFLEAIHSWMGATKSFKQGSDLFFCFIKILLVIVLKRLR